MLFQTRSVVSGGLVGAIKNLMGQQMKRIEDEMEDATIERQGATLYWGIICFFFF